MSGFIPEEIVEQIRSANDIAEVVGAFVTLKRRGRNLIGVCPFHDEKTPSFTVSQEKQFYHCFGCGKGGNVFSFLMEHERMTFPEAARFLAQKSGIRIPETTEGARDRSDTEKLLFAQAVAAEFYRANLRSPAYAQVRAEYLKKTRRITEETIEHFALGVAGDSWRGLLDYAAKKGVDVSILVKGGLATFSESRREHFDRFRERLMIPINNLSDKVIAFGGRTLRSDEPAKYVNSPETPLYSKGQVLYGLSVNRAAIRDSGFVIIVEGYFDLISLWQLGVRNVVASSGTAFTTEQGRLLARFTNKAFLFFDADSAGVKAAIRSVDSLFNAGVDVRVVSAPPGEDPDTMTRRGPEVIQTALTKAERYLQFRFREYRASSMGPVERAAIVKEIQGIAARITDDSVRRIFADEAADILGVEGSLLDTTPGEKRVATIARTEEDWGARGAKTIEAEFVSFLLAHPQLTGHAAETIPPTMLVTARLSQLYATMLESWERTGGLPAAAFIGELTEEPLRQTATFLMTRQWSADSAGATLNDFTAKLLASNAHRPPIDELKKLLREAEKAGDQAKAEELFTEIQTRRHDQTQTPLR